MSDFIFLRKQHGNMDSRLREVKTSLENSVFKKREQCHGHSIDHKDFYLEVFDSEGCKSLVNKFNNNEFIVGMGTFIYKNLTGLEALDLMFRDFSISEHFNSSDFIGNFCILLYKDSNLYVFNDFLGTYKIFHDKSFGIVSSSFLVLLETVDRKTISEQELYEYILTGGVYGDATFVDQIKVIKRSAILNLTKIKYEYEITFEFETGNDRIDFDASVKAVGEEMIEYFGVLKGMGSRFSTALSGGFDSRLMLAALRKVDVTPELYVYGPSNSQDVRVALEICQNEKMQIEHFEKKSMDEDFSMKEIIEQNNLFYDGISNIGIFHNGVDALLRKKRIKDGSTIVLNGGGGEIFRDFWNIPFSKLSNGGFLQYKYGVDSDRFLTNRFDTEKYLKNLSRKLNDSIKNTNAYVDRSSMDKAYAFFRIQFWQNFNTSINLRFGKSLTPLVDPRFLNLALQIPSKFKKYGRFESSLINFLDPKLGQYMSNYGFAFNGSIPLNFRLKEDIKRYLPLNVKKNLKKMSSMSQGADDSFYLGEEYLSKFNVENNLIDDFVQLKEVGNSLILSRCLTANYLVSRYF